MSSMDNAHVTCPKCQNEIVVPVWNSVNVTLDPSFREKAVSGELFRHACEHCGQVSTLVYPCLYHDMNNRFMVWFVPGDEEMESYVKQGDAMGQEGYRLRLVRTENELREKIMILENGLDDRVLEICKYFTLGNAMEKYPDLKLEAAYFYINEGPEYGFVIFTEGRDTVDAGLNIAAYEEAKKLFAPKMAKDEGFQMIDLGWAIEMMK